MSLTDTSPASIMQLDEREKQALTDAYDLARKRVLIAEQLPMDRFLIRGADRIDLLERLSTNTFVDQSEGNFVRTALLEPNGRLIELLEVFIQAGQLLVTTSPGEGETVLAWLKRHIFFQDDITLDRVDPWPRTFELIGPDAKRTLEESFGEVGQLQPNRFFQNASGIIAPMNWPGLNAYHLMLENGNLVGSLTPEGASFPIDILRAAVEAVRIEAGLPRRGHEIIPGVIPLEVGLKDVISFSKGCYIGQEVIARMDSRGSQAAELHGVMLSEPAPAGSPLLQSDKQIGRLTSIAYSPVHAWIGLASVKTRRWDGSSENLTIEGHPVSIQELPFPSP